MKKFVLKIYQLFNACTCGASEKSNAFYKVIDSDGRFLVRAKVDHQKKALILEFHKFD